jgi:serine/threonine protein kinase
MTKEREADDQVSDRRRAGDRGWTCTSVQGFLAGYPDDLTDDTLDAVVAHTETCPNCRALLDLLRPDDETTEHVDLMECMSRGVVDQLESGRFASGGQLRGIESERRLRELSSQFTRGQVLDTGRSSLRIVGLMRKRKYTETYRATQEVSDGGETKLRQAVVAIARVEDVSGQDAEDRLRQLQRVTTAQALELQRLNGLPHVAQLLDSGEYIHHLGDRMVPATFLAYEYVDGVELDSHLRATYANGGEFTGVPSASDFFRHASDLANAVLEIHQRLVIHGDICPQNVLITRDGKPVLVNVGKSVFFAGMSGAGELRGSAYRAPDAAKTPASDLYSLGALYLHLATGEEARDLERYGDRGTLKRHIAARVKAVNPKLYKDDRGVVDIIVACLRQKGRFQHAGELLQDIETFGPPPALRSILDELLGLTDSGAVLDKTGNALFRATAVRKVRALHREMANMCKGVFDISGTSHEIRNAAYALISMLGRGDAFVAISLPCFWSRENILMDGKFLTMSMNAAARGARLRRVFLLDTDLTDPDLREILSAQLTAIADLDESVRKHYQVRYVRMSAERRKRFAASGKHFGMLIKDGDRISMFPVYDGELLVTLRFRSDPRYTEGLVETFESLWEQAQPVDELSGWIGENRRVG